jgi:hypothetical protein
MRKEATVMTSNLIAHAAVCLVDRLEGEPEMERIERPEFDTALVLMPKRTFRVIRRLVDRLVKTTDGCPSLKLSRDSLACRKSNGLSEPGCQAKRFVHQPMRKSGASEQRINQHLNFLNVTRRHETINAEKALLMQQRNLCVSQGSWRVTVRTERESGGDYCHVSVLVCCPVIAIHTGSWAQANTDTVV